MTTVMLVDDSAMERRLISALLVKSVNCDIEFCENGVQAISRIPRIRPDLVLTDLVMPEMNGLQLVRAIRKKWPEIPVVLMTAYGNEETAVEALEAGAASYVPKAQQAERLVETVLRVLARAQSEKSHRKIDTRLRELFCSYTLENDPTLISALVDKFQQTMADIGLADATERVRTCLALEEALLNAMYHGNLEITEQELAEARTDFRGGVLAKLVQQRRGVARCRHREITLDAHISRESARFVVRDDGVGFDHRAAGTNRLSDYFECGRGRGLMLMQSMMDEVSFNPTGNEVTLVKLTDRGWDRKAVM